MARTYLNPFCKTSISHPHGYYVVEDLEKFEAILGVTMYLLSFV